MRTQIMTVAKQRAERLHVKNILVATNTGASMRAAYQVFGPDYHFYAVGNPTSAHEQGLVHHDGVSPLTKNQLEQMGINVVLVERSIFQERSRSFFGVPLDDIIQGCSPAGHMNAISILYNAFQLWGDGPRVCLEITLMAADAGALPLGEDCLAIACPSAYCDLPDAAVVLHPVKTVDMFMGQLRIKDVVLCPTANDVWFSQRPLP
jgi:hypothetical protein